MVSVYTDSLLFLCHVFEYIFHRWYCASGGYLCRTLDWERRGRRYANSSILAALVESILVFSRGITVGRMHSVWTTRWHVTDCGVHHYNLVILASGIMWFKSKYACILLLVILFGLYLLTPWRLLSLLCMLFVVNVDVLTHTIHLGKCGLASRCIHYFAANECTVCLWIPSQGYQYS